MPHALTRCLVSTLPSQFSRSMMRWLLHELGSDGGTVVMVAHNGRRFDFPLTAQQLSRAGFMFPPAWRFLDTQLYAQAVL